MEKKIEKIKTDLKASGISAAIGYCLYDGKTENIEDSVRRAELKMYKDKKEKYL